MKTKRNCELTKQEEFVKAHMHYHHQISSWRFIIFVLFLALWETSAYFGWIDSFFFSSPCRVVLCLVDLFQNNHMITHIGITLYETIISFFLVFLISLLAASALWYSGKLSEILEPYLVILNSLPKSALAPLFIVWLGTGTVTIIVAGISVAVFGSIISIYTGFQQVDPEKVTLIYTLGGRKQDAFFKVILPLSVPGIVSGVLMVFMPTVSSFAVYDILGKDGGNVAFMDGKLFGNIVYTYFEKGYYNSGSALALVLLVLILLSTVASNLITRGKSVKTGGTIS